MERVSVIRGKNPVIITATHGANDNNTTVIAETIAKEHDCYAIINRGFERSESVDSINDQANCNRVDHLLDPVVFDEFLNPLLKITSLLVTKIWSKHGLFHGVPSWIPNNKNITDRILIFHIHGCSNSAVRNNKGEVNVIVGWGKGQKKDSLTCAEWRRDCFLDFMSTSVVSALAATPGGKFSGRSKNNLNQYFRKHQFEKFVESMQLEFPYWTRSSEDAATIIGLRVVKAIKEVMDRDGYVTI